MYRKKSTEERRLFRRKKHEFVKATCKAIEMHDSRNDAGKLFQKIKRMSEGFKTVASCCKQQDMVQINMPTIKYKYLIMLQCFAVQYFLELKFQNLILLNFLQSNFIFH